MPHSFVTKEVKTSFTKQHKNDTPCSLHLESGPFLSAAEFLAVKTSESAYFTVIFCFAYFFCHRHFWDFFKEKNTPHKTPPVIKKNIKKFKKNSKKFQKNFKKFQKNFKKISKKFQKIKKKLKNSNKIKFFRIFGFKKKKLEFFLKIF